VSLPPYDESLVLATCEKTRALYREAGREPDEAYPVWPVRTQRDADAGMAYPASEAKHLRECRDALGLPGPPVPPIAPLTALVVEQGRLRDALWWRHWLGIAEFSAVHLVRTGQEPELVRRLDRAQRYGRTGIRTLMMKAPQTNSTPAWNAFDLAPSMPGYWGAADRVVELAADRGLYVEPCLFADAQIVMPDVNQRRAVCAAFAGWCRQHPTVLPQLANEPFKNGWDSATDPALLDLAAYFLTNYGPGFSVGDPPDVVTDQATGNPLRDELASLAKRSQVLVLHGDRSSSTQWARWVDHLKGFDEVYTNPSACYRIHDEPMGAASVSIDGKRDARPDAHLAASLVCAVMGIGFTYHYISEQDDATPGLDLCAAQALVPASPDFRFKNAGTPGACVSSFSPGMGLDKIRTCDNGRDAWAVGYGQQPNPSFVAWAPGWTPQIVTQTAHVILWHATR
jgi:hypothetical protein